MEEDKYVPSRKTAQDYKIALQFGKERLAKGRNRAGAEETGQQVRTQRVGSFFP